MLTLAQRYPNSHPQLQSALRRGEAALRRAMSGTMRFYNAHEVIIQAGKAHKLVYRLRRGWVFCARTTDDGRRQIISIGMPGELVGLGSMLFTRSPDTIACLTRASVEMIDRDRLLEVALGNADVALRLLFQLGQEQRRLHSWVVSLGHCTAEERLAAMLVDTQERLRVFGVGGRAFRLPLTQKEIGDYIGLTDVHVNRVLRRLRNSGSVSLVRGVAKIGDFNALKLIGGPIRDLWAYDAPAPGQRSGESPLDP